MNPNLSIIPKKPGKFHVGDHVTFKGGWHGVIGLVIEDRGYIGKAKRRYYTVRVKLEDEPTLAFPEDELEPLAS